MGRRTKVVARQVDPDPVYGSRLVAKFVNCLMVKGKKSVSEQVLYRSFGVIEERTKQNPMEVFKAAVENVKPSLEVRSRRVGGATYQVPVEVSPIRRQTLAIRWLIDAARHRSERGMIARLASEFIDASTRQGAAIKKREDTHRMAEANKAFAHYRW